MIRALFNAVNGLASFVGIPSSDVNRIFTGEDVSTAELNSLINDAIIKARSEGSAKLAQLQAKIDALPIMPGANLKGIIAKARKSIRAEMSKQEARNTAAESKISEAVQLASDIPNMGLGDIAYGKKDEGIKRMQDLAKDATDIVAGKNDSNFGGNYERKV